MARTAPQIVVFEQDGALRLRTRSVITLEAAVADTPASSWIQVAVCGSFKKGERKFAITPVMLAEMVDNFSTGRHPVPPTELCIDYEHLSGIDTDNPEAGKAAGWIKQLELRADDAEVWARVEWTPPAAERLRAKEYKFISPEFAFNFMTPTMDVIGCTLLAAAITNRPFLQGMEPIALKAHARGDVALLSDLSYDQQRMVVQQALRDRARSLGAECWPWVAAMNGGVVVYELNSGYLRESYTIDVDGQVTLGDDATEVISTFKPPAEAALREEEGNMAKVTLKSTDGKDVQIDETAFAAAIEASPVVKDLRTKLTAKEAEQTPLQAKVVTLEADVATLKTENAASAKALNERDADAAIEKLVAGGKASNDQRASLKELYLSSKDMFEKITAGFTTRVATGEIGHGGPVAAATGTATARVMAKATELRTANAQLTQEQAIKQALDSDGQLYEQYVRESEQTVGKKT
ncbi:MAG: phage protease [Acidobacteriota bacterium]